MRWLRNLTAAFAAAVCLAYATPSAGQPAGLTEGWRWVHFTSADGLPADMVSTAVDVQPDVFWAATGGGLARYDGYRWTRVPLPPGFDGFASRLVGDGRGGLVALVHNRLAVGGAGGFRIIDAAPAGKDAYFVTCARAGRGPVLLQGSDGVLYEWDGQTVRRHAAFGPFGRVISLQQAGPSAVWASSEGGIVTWDGETWRLRLRPRTAPYQLLAAFEAEDGRAWVSVASPADALGLWRWDSDGTPGLKPVPVSSPIVALATIPGGAVLAVHITGELGVLQGDRWEPLPTGPVRIVDAHKVGVRPNGDVWAATDHGLFLYRRSVTRWRFVSFPAPDGRNGVSEIARSPDAIWAGTTRGLVRLLPSGQSEHITRAGTETLTSLTGVAWDAKGRLWISSGSAFTGVRWLDRDGWHRLTIDPVLDRTYVHKIVTDRSGVVWFLGLLTESGPGEPTGAPLPGAFRLDPAGGITRWGEREGLASGRVYALAEGPDGALWFGTSSGLSRWAPGAWRHWSVSDGMRTPRVFTLAVDREGTVWFGHQGAGFGLGQLKDGRIRYFTADDGVLSDQVWTVKPDDRGRLWVAGLSGISVLENGHWTSFDSRSGLPSPRVWPVLPEGNRVWFGMTGGGLGMLDLSNPAPPPKVLPGVPVVGGSGVLVPWRAASWWGELASADIPTRLRLDEGGWTPWSTERDSRFEQLEPGAHSVSLQAKGLVGTAGPVSRVVFTIDPPLVRRPVFYVPMALLAFVIVGLVYQITIRQRRHRDELVAREQRFRKAFAGSPLSTTISDLETGQLLDVNDAFERTFGYQRDDIIGRTAQEIGFIAEPPSAADVLALVGRRDERRGVPVQVRRKSGETADTVVYLEIIDVGGRQALLSQALDVSEQRRLEAQLRQSQKMESVGRLAGGVAHDFNNLLTVILGNASLLDEALPSGDPRREEIEQITIAAQRAERLTKQLLAFARKQRVEPRVLNLNDVVHGIDRMLRRLIGEDIELVTIMEPDLGRVLADPGQIEQVLVNLAVNARDAMPAGGTLTLKTANAALTESSPRREPDTVPGPYVRLSVTDTGSGMDVATAARVFEPFFTTKDAGKGTGLGLATCYGIVKQARGQITFDTAPGSGCTFHIDLPLVPASGAAPEAHERPPDLPAGHETVLLVEDEVQVRRLAASVLRQRGYDVIEAASGPEALRIAEGYASSIDVLVTDIVMPQMRGTELARLLRAARPAVKVLFMSGYTEDELLRPDAGGEGTAFLGKPFTPIALALRVRALLDASEGG